MPRMATAGKKTGGAAGKVILVVVVVLVGAGVGAYFWNKASAKSTAARSIELSMELTQSTDLDLTELKGLLCKADVEKLEESEAALRAAHEAMGPQLQAMASSLTYEQEVGKVSAGFSEATVDIKVKVTGGPGGASQTQDVTVVLIREGLAWKVSSDRTNQASGGSGGMPGM